MTIQSEARDERWYSHATAAPIIGYFGRRSLRADEWSLLVMHFGPQFIDRWYMGAFLVIWGAWLIARAKSMNDIRDNFDDDPRPELQAVVERRQQLEARPIEAWYVTGASAILCGIATLCALLNGGLAYAISLLVLVSTLAFGYLRMRNAGPRRAAALVPRRIGSLIAWPWYPLGILTALSPLTFLNVPSQRLAAVLVSISAFAIMFLAFRINGMAALLTGDDVDLELYVDDCLRRWRVNGFWTISMAIALVYVILAAGSVSQNMTLLQTIAFYGAPALGVIRYVARHGPDWLSAVRRLVHS
jgi:hypothetical protein